MSSADVLMIEDDLDIPVLAQTIAEELGIRVDCTSSGAQGVDMAQDPPGLIILDLQLPDLHGHDILRHLTKLAPVIVFTGTSANDRGSRRHGALLHVRKPADGTEFEGTLKAMLEGGRLITEATGFDGDEIDAAARSFPLGTDRFMDYLGRAIDAMQEAGKILQGGDSDLIVRRAHQIRPHVARLGRMGLADALESVEHARGDDQFIRAACAGLVLERMAADLRRIVPVKVLN